MTGRRVVVGKFNDGVTFGLRVSLSGIDALIDSSANGDFSFDSTWTDIAQVNALGTATSSGGAISVTFPNQGYVPFLEMRRIESGNILHDDWLDATWKWGSGSVVDTSSLTTPSTLAAGVQILYVVYKIPVSG